MHALTKDFSDITKGILDVLIHPHKQKEGHPSLCSLMFVCMSHMKNFGK